MSSPGWYPDPSGQPHSFRFWDGQSWSQQTTDNPYSPPPGQWVSAPAPQPPQEPVQPPVTPEAQQPVEPVGEQPVQPPAASGPEATPDSGQYGGSEQAPWQQAPQTQQVPPSQPNPAYDQTQQVPQSQPNPAEQTAQFSQQGWQEQPATQFGGGDPQYAQQPYGQQPQQPQGQQGFAQFGDQQWSPTPAAGGGGGSKKALWIVIAAVVAIALIVGGIIAAIQLTGDDDKDASAKDKASQTVEPTDEATDEPTDTQTSPEEDASPSAPTEEESSTDEPSLPAEPAADVCIGGDPTLRSTHPEDGRIHGGGLVLDPIKGYLDQPVGDVYTFASDVATVTRETQAGKWVSVYALGALPKEKAGSDLEAAARAVVECMANSTNFYQSLDQATELSSDSGNVDGADAWSVRSEIRVSDPSVEAGGDVAQVIVVDTGDPDNYGLFAAVVPLNDRKLLERLDTVLDNLTLD